MNDLLGTIGADLPSLADVLLHLLLAFALGQLVAWVYTWTHTGTSYSRSQVHSYVLLALIVTVVMIAIGNNLARAFGLFGALALIRFRTPIKDARDTTFLFLSVAVGITVGTGNIPLALVGTVFSLLVVSYLSFSHFGERDDTDSVLRFSMPARSEHEARLRGVLNHHCARLALMHLRDAGAATMELAYRVRLHDPRHSDALILDLAAIPGVRGASILMQNEDEEP